MKKFIDKIGESYNQLSDSVKTIILVGIFVIALMLSKYADSSQVIIVGVIMGFVMLTYSIMSIIKHEDITKTLIYLIVVIMTIPIIITYHFKSVGVDFNAFGVIFPILLMFFFIIGYMNVKKSGNKQKIKVVRIYMILGLVLMALVEAFFIYMLFFK